MTTFFTQTMKINSAVHHTRLGSHLTFDPTFVEWSAGCSSSPVWAWPWSPCPACGGRRGRAPRCPGPRRSGTPSHRCRTRSSFLTQRSIIKNRLRLESTETITGSQHHHRWHFTFLWSERSSHLDYTPFIPDQFSHPYVWYRGSARHCDCCRLQDGGDVWEDDGETELDVTVLCSLYLLRWAQQLSAAAYSLPPAAPPHSFTTPQPGHWRLETMTHSHQGNKTQPRLSFPANG